MTAPHLATMDSLLPQHRGASPPRLLDRGPTTTPDDRRVELRGVDAERISRLELAEALTPLPAMLRVKNARLGLPLRTHELEDVVQNTLLAVLGKLCDYDGRVPVLRWAYGFGIIEVHRAIERRARRREQEHKAEPVDEPARDGIDRERLVGALEGLDRDDRLVIERRHFAEEPFEAIADGLRVPLSTVKSRYYRGMQRLRDKVRAAEARDR
ncbi:MAG: sigma-70 family RNA polymerase sigma factor [Planctomycetes bacterium]|nr:sigma-70 family RNA polymerase sigma factor [Planctomycetota bacterium]